MAKLILHTNADVEAINQRRLEEFFALLPEERLKQALKLKRLALLFKNRTIKEPTS